MSLFRYPGGKSKLSSVIINKLFEFYTPYMDYCEPFFGGGSIGMELLSKYNFTNVNINDKDAGIYCIWRSIIAYPTEFKALIKNYVPTVDDFYTFKRDLLELTEHSTSLPSDDVVLSIALKKIAIHQMSYSGLGTKSGGPLGGLTQESKYKINCRWSPSYICNKIDKLHKTLAKHSTVSCYCMDVFALMDFLVFQTLIYLDPPYFKKGDALYQVKFSYDDHVKLSEYLKNTTHKWVLSYDDCPEIRELYQWAKIDEIMVNYTIKTTRSKKELLIYK